MPIYNSVVVLIVESMSRAPLIDMNGIERLQREKCAVV